MAAELDLDDAVGQVSGTKAKEELATLRARLANLHVSASRYMTAAKRHNQSPFDVRVHRAYTAARDELQAAIDAAGESL